MLTKILLFPIKVYHKIIKIFVNFALKLSMNKVGKKVCIDYPYNYIGGLKYISIGDNCLIAKHCYLYAYDYYENNIFNPEIAIDDNFIIGANS